MTGGGAERSREVRDPQGGAPGRFRGQEIAQARDDREPEPGVAPPDASDGLGDAGHLGIPQRLRDCVDRGLVEDLTIATHHSRQPLSGKMSVVVEPTSIRMQLGKLRATRRAGAAQLGAAIAGGWRRASSAVSQRPSAAYTRTRPSENARVTASTTNATPSRLVRKICDSSAVMVTA